MTDVTAEPKVRRMRIDLQPAEKHVTIQLHGRIKRPPVVDQRTPVLVGKCRCGALLVTPINTQEQHTAWVTAQRIELECANCRMPLWAQRRLVALAR